MYNKEITVVNATGLHARPASDFVTLAGKFKSSIHIQRSDEERKYNGKSMVMLMTLGLAQGESHYLRRGRGRKRGGRISGRPCSQYEGLNNTNMLAAEDFLCGEPFISRRYPRHLYLAVSLQLLRVLKHCSGFCPAENLSTGTKRYASWFYSGKGTQ